MASWRMSNYLTGKIVSGTAGQGESKTKRGRGKNTKIDQCRWGRTGDIGKRKGGGPKK